MASPTGIRGSSEAKGSWKTTWICRRIFAHVAGCPARSAPSLRTCTEPDVGLISCSTDRPVVDLPHPDSPTRPSVSPAAMVKETPHTAWTTPTLCRTKRPAAHRELLDEVCDLQQRPGGCGRGRRSTAPSVRTTRHAITLSTTPSENTAAMVAPPDRLGEVAGGTVLAPLRGDRGHDEQVGFGLAGRSSAASGQRGAKGHPPAVAEHGGRGPGDLAQPLAPVAVEAGERAEQPERVGHGRPVEDVLGRPDLDRPPGVHHEDPVGQAGDDAEIVGDEQQRRTASRSARS